MPPILILVGPVGSSKTALMNHLLRRRQVARDRLLINNGAFLPSEDGEGIKTVIPFDKFETARHVKCCNWAIDEVGIVINSRESQSLPKWARNKLFERRKDDIDRLFMTVQAVSDCDVSFRRFAKQGGEIWTPRLVRIPFLGLFKSDTVRDELPCPWKCGGDCTTLPGGEGDRSTWYHRLFMVGTVFVFEVWDIADLIKDENGKSSSAGGDDDEEVPGKMGWDWCWWSQREAGFFASHSKVSDSVDSFEEERNNKKRHLVHDERRKVGGMEVAVYKSPLQGKSGETRLLT